MIHEFDEEEQNLVRKEEIVFEDKYKDIYELRRKYVTADKSLDALASAELIK